MHNASPKFNLWTEPWIQVETLDGNREYRSIAETLLNAQHYVGIVELTPLVEVGIHRLLTAILQDLLAPKYVEDIAQLLKSGQFPSDLLEDFGCCYGHHFDLFSTDHPFLQSGDLSLTPAQNYYLKTVAYLTPEIPSGGSTHYRHGRSEDQLYCCPCVAGALAAVPAFTTSGGRGLKPSINGVPPIYVLPRGASLFESLVTSLIAPEYQPEVRSKEEDLPWWKRSSKVVCRDHEVLAVGYVQSLTFPARRIRLHPERMTGRCTRCGQQTTWGVRTMIFEMGETRPKGSAVWFDPFAAYRSAKKATENPTPLRPEAGKALWREFVGLFLEREGKDASTKRPRVLDQFAELEEYIRDRSLTRCFHCVGLRTDNKAKVFEWIDVTFDLPPAILSDRKAAITVEKAIDFATEAARIVDNTFRSQFGGNSKKGKRHCSLQAHIQREFWGALAAPFRDFISGIAGRTDDERCKKEQKWYDIVVEQAEQVFRRAIEAVGDDATSLRNRVVGENRCTSQLNKKRKDYMAWPNENRVL